MDHISLLMKEVYCSFGYLCMLSSLKVDGSLYGLDVMATQSLFHADKYL